MELLQDDEALALAELLLGPAPKTIEPAPAAFLVPQIENNSNLGSASFAANGPTGQPVPGPASVALLDPPPGLEPVPNVGPLTTIDLRTEPAELDLLEKSEISRPLFAAPEKTELFKARPVVAEPEKPVTSVERAKPELFKEFPVIKESRILGEPEVVAKPVLFGKPLSSNPAPANNRRSTDSGSIFPERVVVEPKREVSSLFGSQPVSSNLASPVSKGGLFGLQNFEEPAGVRMIPADDARVRRNMTPWYLGVGVLLAVGAGLGAWSITSRGSSADVSTSGVSLIPATVLTAPAPAVAVTAQGPNTTVLVTAAPVTTVETTELVADTNPAETSPSTTAAAVSPRPAVTRPARPAVTTPATTAPAGTIPTDATVEGLTPPTWQSEATAAPTTAAPATAAPVVTTAP